MMKKSNLSLLRAVGVSSPFGLLRENVGYLKMFYFVGDWFLWNAHFVGNSSWKKEAYLLLRRGLPNNIY